MFASVAKTVGFLLRHPCWLQTSLCALVQTQNTRQEGSRSHLGPGGRTSIVYRVGSHLPPVLHRHAAEGIARLLLIIGPVGLRRVEPRLARHEERAELHEQRLQRVGGRPAPYTHSEICLPACTPQPRAARKSLNRTKRHKGREGGRRLPACLPACLPICDCMAGEG